MALDNITELVREDSSLNMAPVVKGNEGQHDRNRAVITFRSLCAKHTMPMWLLDGDRMVVLGANDVAVQLCGYSKFDGTLAAGNLFPKLDTRRLRLSDPLRTVVRTRTGQEHDVELTANASFSSGESVIFVVGRRMHDLVKSQAQLRERDKYLDLASVAIVVADAREIVLHWNQRAADLYGWTETETVGKPLNDFVFPGAMADLARRGLQEKGEWEGELTPKNRAGKPLHFQSHWRAVRDDAGNTKSIIIVNVDISTQKALEAQYLRSQRLESIGTLASGIAHDLNNILTPILMSVGILRKREDVPENLKLLSAIESSAERGADIVRQVLTFARGVVGERIVLPLAPLVNELTKILAQTFPRNISVKTELAPDLTPISGDATQIHQVLLNLCVNARDAMPDGGQITLRTSNVTLTAEQCPPHEAVQPGPHVLVEVADTGTGISPEVIDRIFDPFFTTKEPGKGTGLGLATVRGILKSHGGGMAVESEIGKGTTFKLYFPAVQESAIVEGGEKKKGEAPRGRGEMILVVDDEPAVRIGMVSVLQAHGYGVYTAEDGNDALALFFQRKSEIDAIITDLNMEQMDGLQLARAAKRLRPETAIVVSSGQLTDDSRASFAEMGVTNFLEKPFKPERLLHAVYDVLHAN